MSVDTSRVSDRYRSRMCVYCCFFIALLQWSRALWYSWESSLQQIDFLPGVPVLNTNALVVIMLKNDDVLRTCFLTSSLAPRRISPHSNTCVQELRIYITTSTVLCL